MTRSLTRSIVLIGLRGSGKTTLARLLAAQFGCRTIDLDDITPQVLHHRTVADAFSACGEPAFRAAEFAALKQTLDTPDRLVLALGGGTPTAPGAAELLRSHQDGSVAGREPITIVYLRGSAALLRSRLAGDDNAHRPSLTGKSVLDEIADLLTIRDPLYRGLARVTIDLDARANESPEQIARAIAQLV